MTIVILYVTDAQTMEATTIICLQPSVFAFYSRFPTYAIVAFRGNCGQSNFTQVGIFLNSMRKKANIFYAK